MSCFASYCVCCKDEDYPINNITKPRTNSSNYVDNSPIRYIFNDNKIRKPPVIKYHDSQTLTTDKDIVCEHSS